MNHEPEAGESVARWLQEAARRRSPAAVQAERDAADTPDVVLKHLETVFGRPLSTCQRVDELVKELCAQDRARTRAGRRSGILRGSLLLVALLASFLQYYYWDVNLQIAKLQRIEVFVPFGDAGGRPKPYTPSGQRNA